MTPRDDGATPRQLAFLAALTGPDALARLSRGEATSLIGFLKGPPPNMSRAQQLRLIHLLEALDRADVRELIGELIDRVAAGRAESGGDHDRAA